MSRIEKLRALIRENEQDLFLNHALALEHIKIGEDDVAEQVFRTLLAADPGYVGSYYHLGKLLERKGDEAAAIRVYKQGMEEAQKKGDAHAYGELRAACEYLEF